MSLTKVIATADGGCETVPLSPEEEAAVLAEWAANTPTQKEQLAAYAVSVRVAAVNAGLLFDGHPIPTDETGRGFVTGAFSAASADPDEEKDWQISNEPITFVHFTNAQLVALGLATNAMVQACFDTLKTVGEGIEAGTITTTGQIDTAFAAVQRVYTTPA